jgi:hypothetical protein
MRTTMSSNYESSTAANTVKLGVIKGGKSSNYRNNQASSSIAGENAPFFITDKRLKRRSLMRISTIEAIGAYNQLIDYYAEFHKMPNNDTELMSVFNVDRKRLKDIKEQLFIILDPHNIGKLEPDACMLEIKDRLLKSKKRTEKARKALKGKRELQEEEENEGDE